MKGYKGFRKGLISSYNKYLYEVDETYKFDNTGYYKDISLCNRGFHFSSNLTDVFTYYPNKDDNEFCEIEALGKILTGSDKSCTDEIKIVRKLSKEEIEEIYNKEKEEYEDTKVYCLDIIKHLQRKYDFSIGGSVALYLNGLKLNRNRNSIDFDCIFPYYQKITPDKQLIEGCEEFNAKSSGNDFSTTFALTTKDGRFLKLDIRIKPEQIYEHLEYKGVTYKTSSLMQILAAKTRYALEGNVKHQEDMFKLLGIKQKDNKIISDNFLEDI